MATIKNVKLEAQLNGGPNSPVTIVLDYDIEFSNLDRNENIHYREQARLIGDDTNVPGDILNGGDDQLPAVFDQVTATAGQQGVRRHLVKQISRSAANEDSGIGAKDELRAEVSLDAVNKQLKTVQAQSNPVVARF